MLIKVKNALDVLRGGIEDDELKKSNESLQLGIAVNRHLLLFFIYLTRYPSIYACFTFVHHVATFVLIIVAVKSKKTAFLSVLRCFWLSSRVKILQVVFYYLQLLFLILYNLQLLPQSV